MTDQELAGEFRKIAHETQAKFGPLAAGRTLDEDGSWPDMMEALGFLLWLCKEGADRA